ncbi:hypothetical protein TNIN_117611 [Trichonephila inaurata madagascariensis]|uniref:Uncharacterized protein n=1 Tax=Trichonephila inaurata madagascariensis TaxID=2747483 RepID=A0A8X6IJ69_9ARAC|nr:hypothetical protein TNIN_117611 [Trichonephila inaurata madagascariensis]
MTSSIFGRRAISLDSCSERKEFHETSSRILVTVPENSAKKNYVRKYLETGHPQKMCSYSDTGFARQPSTTDSNSSKLTL